MVKSRSNIEVHIYTICSGSRNFAEGEQDAGNIDRRSRQPSINDNFLQAGEGRVWPPWPPPGYATYIFHFYGLKSENQELQ